MDEGEAAPEGQDAKHDEPQKSEPAKETYSITVHCKNCHAPQSIKPEKGTTVEAFSKELECKYCGCKAGFME